MPKNPITRLALRIARDRVGCSLCNATCHDGKGIFALFGILEDGCDRIEGPFLCPECVHKHGYAGAVLLGLKEQEKQVLKDERREIKDGRTKPGQLKETRAEYTRLRGLVTSGHLTTPPPIGAEHFAAAGSL